MISRGSEWRRWEPHIHAPGTVLNDQFGGDCAWNDYFTALEGASPRIEALGVTDYYVTDTYEEVLRHRATGRLPHVQLVFPNIELRLDVAAKSGFVNIHLLISPEDPDHLQEARRILTRLQFNAYGDRFDCTRQDLIRLGKKADPAVRDERAALAHGATQFKVNFSQLREVYKESSWAKGNILIAVAGSEGDGTSGVRQASDATVRQEIERFAHVIFSSSAAQREFWLGKRSASLEHLRERYDGRKPCFHGSDAHEHSAIGRPVANRFSWIKGAPTFDALRQACIDPEWRAFVGVEPPPAALPSQAISLFEISEAPWVSTRHIPLNAGLVAIVGARGSGKTALADMIASGCDAIPDSAWTTDETVSSSFLARARPLLGDGKVSLLWGGGTTTTRRLDGQDAASEISYARARYLSQQFVEDLCSAKGASEGLVNEIERVIFEAHAPEEREGATSFAELREHRTSRYQQARRREVESIADISERIAEELEKEASVGSLKSQVAQKEDLLKGYNADLAKLVVVGTEVEARRHATLNEAVQQRNSDLSVFGAQRRTFIAMQDEVKNTRAAKAPAMLRDTQARHATSGLSPDQWSSFLLDYKGNVDQDLKAYIAWADEKIAAISGETPQQPDPATSLIAETADLSAVPLATLRAEMVRLEARMSADSVVRSQYSALSKRITTENGALKVLQSRLDDASKAAERRKSLQANREDAYGRLFGAIINEQNALTDLYTPLMKRLSASTGTLRKLCFSVSREVASSQWADGGEDLIDCRKAGAFYGRGALLKVVDESLTPTWQKGSADDVRAAMSAFIAKHSRDLLSHAPIAQSDHVEFRSWLRQFAHWLFDTDHIAVRYEISYDGVDIRKLSPGTRGVVLLLLYLALDDDDDRPLIIDQPEENLDPKSVFDELVPLFTVAKSKRQVIIVTHNANLVINTDADQVIVASAGPHANGGLPAITYMAGGLEDAAIREMVCDILEGGADAFRERARRLRVRLDR